MSDSDKEKLGEEEEKSSEETSEETSGSEQEAASGGEESESSDEGDAPRKKDEDESDEDDEEESDDDDEEESDEDDEEEARAQENGAGDSRSNSSLLIGVLALAAGFGVGWFGHDYQVQKAAKTADAAVEGEGEGARGPCKDWETALCSKFGEKSYPCVQAQSGSSLLSGSACEQAIKTLDSQVAKIEAARASCNNLMDKLCGELGAESKACELVKTQTPNFPPQRCDDMMKNYDQVLGQLKMMEERGAIPGQGGHGGPPGRPPMRGGPPNAGPVQPGSGSSTPAPAKAPSQTSSAPSPKPAEPAPKPTAPAPKPAAPAPAP